MNADLRKAAARLRAAREMHEAAAWGPQSRKIDSAWEEHQAARRHLLRLLEEQHGELCPTCGVPWEWAEHWIRKHQIPGSLDRVVERVRAVGLDVERFLHCQGCTGVSVEKRMAARGESP